MAKSLEPELRKLALLYNVQTSYYDVFGRLRHASEEEVLRVLRILGAPVERLKDVPGAMRERRQFLCRRLLDPVTVAWDGRAQEPKLRLQEHLAETPVRYEIALEGGQVLNGTLPPARLEIEGGGEIEGVRYVSRRFKLPKELPFGYHRLRIDIQQESSTSLVISAPLSSYQPNRDEEKAWGIFLPLYALQSQQSWGSGDLTELGRLLDWTGSLGGEVVGTLPLLASFLGEPFEPSPYSPASRLFWNEFYIDVTRAPEFEHSPRARKLSRSREFQSDLQKLRSASLVDYRRLMGLKRRVLEELSQSFFSGADDQRRRDFQRFLETHPQVEDYARFRATMERKKKLWTEWQEMERDGKIREGDFDASVCRYYVYAQWLAEEQIRTLTEKSSKQGAKLYLDFPLGVHRDGYDVWRERDAFAPEVSGGAPPDGFFTKGQNWSFPPLHPESLRSTGYRYFIDCLRHHLEDAGLLRIDHVMGLHRLYWIPHGMDASNGVYVHYRPEEFYAILSLESHRHRAVIVGENLGTVPPYVNTSMERHGIRGMSVGQFCIHPDPSRALEDVAKNNVASLNTHDTPTFAAFWQGLDIEDRREMGLLDDREALVERGTRSAQKEALVSFLKNRGWIKEESPDAATVLKAWLAHMGSGAAEIVLVNLEDLWLETRPQNVPGTSRERPNWRRKARYEFEEFSRLEEVLNILKALIECRGRR